MKQQGKDLKLHIREVWRLSLPAILTQIVTIAMEYIDSAMVGSMGANASAAIGLVASSTWLLSGVIYAVSAGFSVQVAHRIGAEDEKGARLVVKHGLISAIIISGLLCILGASISGFLPGWLGGNKEIAKDASAYFFIYAMSLPFFQMNSLNSSFLQCSGDMVTPGILNSLMCVLDVIFNALLIPRFGVMGAALGTALACGVISVNMMYRCCVKNEKLSLVKRRKTEKSSNMPDINESFTLDWDILKKAFRIGSPVAVQEIAMCGAMVASTVIIAPLGTVAIAANSFAVTAESLCYMPGYGIGSAATTVVGRSVGAGNMKLAKQYGYICTAMGAIMMGITGGLMMIFCPFVFRLLTPDLAVRELAAAVLRIGLIAEPLFGVSIVAAGALRGTGDTLVPSLMNLGSIWIVRIGLALMLVGTFGLNGMWIAMATELCVRGLLMLYRHVTSPYYKQKIENGLERD